MLRGHAHRDKTACIATSRVGTLKVTKQRALLTALSVGITKNSETSRSGKELGHKAGSALHVSQRQSDMLDLESHFVDVLNHRGRQNDHGCRHEHEAQIRQGQVDKYTIL